MSLGLSNSKTVRRAIALGVAAMAAACAIEVGCSSSGTTPTLTGGPEVVGPGSLPAAGDTGTVGLSLVLPGGDSINGVTYTLLNASGTPIPLALPNPGTVATGNSSSIQFQIGGVPAGSGDSITLAATTLAGATCQGSAAGITIAPRVTTSVTVQMLCTAAGVEAGNLFVTATASYCGTWTALSSGSNGSEANVGETITLTVTANGEAPANLGYTWSQSALSDGGVVGVLGTTQFDGGTFPDEAVGPSDSNSFLCTAPGTTTITVVVDDGPLPSGAMCASGPSTVTTTVTCDAVAANQVESAWVELGSNGNPVARAITEATSCPTITLNGGTPQPMNLRIGAGTEPFRTTTSTTAANGTGALGPQASKPSVFPINTCEVVLPPGTTSAVVGATAADGGIPAVAGMTLPLPKANPTKMIVIGDTGCRLKAAIPASGDQFQGCNDSTQYPFQQLANLAASFHPDVVLHVGDYQYRENECPPDQANCAGSPWGYGWDTWQADFFQPAANLLAAAPWIVTRGNHEQCTRAGQGWYRFLDTNPYSEAQSCNLAANDAVLNTTTGVLVGGAYNTPYAVPLGANSQVIVFDSNNVGAATVTQGGSSNFTTYQSELQTAASLTTGKSIYNIWSNHHPLLGFAPNAGAPPSPGNQDLLSVMAATYPTTLFPPNINLAVHGHTHIFEGIDFTSSNYPATFVTGNAGTLLDIALPDPFPTSAAAGADPVGTTLDPAGNVAVSTLADSAGFGFLLMQYTGGVWVVTEYSLTGAVRTVCTVQLTGQMSCTVNGYIP
jgi:hypothetical protein